MREFVRLLQTDLLVRMLKLVAVFVLVAVTGWGGFWLGSRLQPGETPVAVSLLSMLWVVTVLMAVVVVPRILTWLNAQFKDGAQHALQVGTSIAEIKNQRVVTTARRSALDLPSLNRPTVPPLQAVAREALPMPRIQVLDED